MQVFGTVEVRKFPGPHDVFWAVPTANHARRRRTGSGVWVMVKGGVRGCVVGWGEVRGTVEKWVFLCGWAKLGKIAYGKMVKSKPPKIWNVAC